MSYDSRKTQTKFRILETTIWRMVWNQGNVRLFPRTPFHCGGYTSGTIAIEQQRVIGIDDTHMLER